MEMEGLAGDGGRGHKRGRVTKVEWREHGDGLRMGMETEGSSPSKELE